MCTFAMPAFAMENAETIDNIEIITIDKEDVTDSDTYTIPQSKLKNTRLEGKIITIEDEIVYVNGARSATVSVYITGVLIGWLIDGVLVYYTGYSGPQLLALGVQSLVNAWNRYQNMTEAYFNSYNSYLSSFKLSNGNQCVATSATTYACMYSL